MGTTGNNAFDAYYDGGLSALISGGSIEPAWSPDGKAMAYIDGPADERRAWVVDLETGERRELLDIETMRRATQTALGVTPAGRGLPFSSLTFAEPRSIQVRVGATSLAIDLDTGAVSPLSPDGVVPEQFLATRLGVFDAMPAFEILSPDGAYLLSVRDFNVVIRATADGRQVKLTNDGEEQDRWRIDFVDPVIALFTPGLSVTNWSPDGARVAAYRDDYRGVERRPRMHNLKRTDEVVYFYHARAGGTLERTTLYVLDTFGRQPVQLDLGNTEDEFVIHAGWLVGSDELLIFRITRDCRSAGVWVANATTGSSRPIFAEEGATFVRIWHDVYTGRKLGLWIVPDGEHLLWRSERSGINQLYLYDMDGKVVAQLTNDEGPVDYVARIDENYVYYTAHCDSERPYDTHVMRVPLYGGPSQRITDGTGFHVANIAPQADYFVDTVSSADEPPTAVLRRTSGEKIIELSTADMGRLDALGWVPPREFITTAADGVTELWGTMFFPNDFDPNNTYPVIEHIYGGPYWLVAPHSFEPMWYAKYSQALAQFGYVVVMLDARGTPERSKAFHDVVVNNWAGSVIDHAEAIRQLGVREHFIDSERAGVIGHSWGGYFAFRCLVDHPDVYKAGVTCSPGVDVYESLLYEPYLGFPQNNRAAFEAADVFPLVSKLQSALMIVCGTMDHFTWTDAVKLVESLIRAGKSHEFVLLPEQGHFYDPLHDRYFWRKVAEFFRQNLRPDEHYESLWTEGEEIGASQTTPKW